jgi:hypothetical protein
MMKTWTFIDKSEWGDGPWQQEPDKVEWRDAATGLPCLIRRSEASGALCGYVGVPPSHPWHGLDYQEVEADVHGGLTFADRCHEQVEHGICHTPEPGEPDVWWLGFDCGHLLDILPGTRAHLRRVGFWRELFPDETYKPLAFVQAEVESLAAQAAAVTFRLRQDRGCSGSARS